MNCMRGSSKQLGRDARISFDLRTVKILSESSDCTNESVDDINNLIEPEQVTHNSVDRVWIWNKSDPLDRSIEMVESVENSCKLGDKVDVSVDGGKRFYKPKVNTPGNKLTGSVDCFQILNNFTDPVAQAIVSVELCDTVKQSIETVDNVKQSIETVDNVKQSIETVDNVKQSIESVDNVKQSIDTVDNVNFLCKLVKQSEETVDQVPISPCLQETGEQLYKIYDNDLKCLQETSKKSGEMFNFGTSWNKDKKVTVDGNRSSESVKQSAEETDGLKFLHETSKKHGKPGVKYWSDSRNQSNKAFVIGQIQCDIEMPTGKTVDDTTCWSPGIRIGETDCETFLGKTGTMLFEPASSELLFPGPLDKREDAVDCGTFLSDFINEGSEMIDSLNVTKSGEQPYVVVDVWPNCEPDASPYKNVYIFPNRVESGQVRLAGQSSERVLFDSVEDNVINRDKDKVNTEFDQSNMDIRSEFKKEPACSPDAKGCKKTLEPENDEVVAGQAIKDVNKSLDHCQIATATQTLLIDEADNLSSELLSHVCKKCHKAYNTVIGLRVKQNTCTTCTYCRTKRRGGPIKSPGGVDKEDVNKAKSPLKTRAQNKVLTKCSYDDKRNVQCDQCTKKFINLAGLVNHRRIIHCNVPLLLASDLNKFRDLSSSKTIQVKMALDVQEGCKRKAPFNLTKIVRRKGSVKLNSVGIDLFKCDLCPRQFNVVKGLIVHYRMAHHKTYSHDKVQSPEYVTSTSKVHKNQPEELRTNKMFGSTHLIKKRNLPTESDSRTVRIPLSKARLPEISVGYIPESERQCMNKSKDPGIAVEDEDDDKYLENRETDNSSAEADSSSIESRSVPPLHRTTDTNRSEKTVKRGRGRPPKISNLKLAKYDSKSSNSNYSKPKNEFVLDKLPKSGLEDCLERSKWQDPCSEDHVSKSSGSSGSKHIRLKHQSHDDIHPANYINSTKKGSFVESKEKSIQIIYSDSESWKDFSRNLYEPKNCNPAKFKHVEMEFSKPAGKCVTNFNVVTKSKFNSANKTFVKTKQSLKLRDSKFYFDKYLVVRLRRCDEKWETKISSKKGKIPSQKRLSDIKTTSHVGHNRQSELSPNHGSEVSHNRRSEVPHNRRSELSPNHGSEVSHNHRLEVSHNPGSELSPNHGSEVSHNRRSEVSHKCGSEVSHNRGSEVSHKRLSEGPHNRLSEGPHNRGSEVPHNRRSEGPHNRGSEVPHNHGSEVSPNQVSEVSPNRVSEVFHNRRSKVSHNHGSEVSHNHGSEVSHNRRSEGPHNRVSEVPHNRGSEVSHDRGSKVPHNRGTELPRRINLDLVDNTPLLYRCKNCVKAFYDIKQLKDHRLSMHIPFSSQFRCGVCSAMFETLNEAKSCFYSHTVQASDTICLD